MAVKIKLTRLGKIREPYYRIVVADARTKRDGRAIESIGKYHPKDEPCVIEIDSERAQYWLGVGAQPTESVRGLLEGHRRLAEVQGPAGRRGHPEGRSRRRPTSGPCYEAALAAIGGEPTPRRHHAAQEGHQEGRRRARPPRRRAD